MKAENFQQRVVMGAGMEGSQRQGNDQLAEDLRLKYLIKEQILLKDERERERERERE